MISVSPTRGYAEAVDGRDTSGHYLTIQLGPLLFMFYIGWGR